MRYLLITVLLLAMAGSAMAVTSVDFESLTGYYFATDGAATLVQSTAQAHSGQYSAEMYLPSGSVDFAKIIIPCSTTLGETNGTFWAYLPSSSPAGLAPYMYFIADADGSGTYNYPNDAIIIAFVTGSQPYPQDQWFQDGIDGDTTVHVVGNRTGLAAGTFSSSGTQDTLDALRAMTFSGSTKWGDLNLLQARVGAGEWPGAGAYTAYVDDVTVLFPIWYTIRFTGADIFNFTTSVAALADQDAPRRLRDWTDYTLNSVYWSNLDANGNGTNDFAEWAAENLAAYGLSYFNLWGASIAPSSWDQPYHAVPDLGDGRFGADSWRNMTVNGEPVASGSGTSPFWTGGIVLANQSYNSTDYAFPVWRTPVGTQLTAADANTRFSVDVLIENPETAFESDGRLRVWFGGYDTPQGTGGHAQELSGVILVPINELSLVPSEESLYIKPGETIHVDMKVAGLQQMVTGCQAMLGYSSTYFADPTDQGGLTNYFAITPGGGAWDELIYDSWKHSTGVPGEIDTAIGVYGGTTTGTDADGTVCKITLTSIVGQQGVTQIEFRADDLSNDNKTTRLTDMQSQDVWPAKVNSQTIVIDGTAPQITIPDDYSTTVAQASIVASATDTYLKSFTMNGAAFTSPTPVVLTPGANTFVFVAEDMAGNTITKTLTITYNQPAPAIELYASLAPNLYGSASSWSAWKVNAFNAILTGQTAVGVGTTTYNTFKDLGFAKTLDYGTCIVTTGSGTWLGLVDGSSELGTAVQFAYKIDNGVVGNPGATKLDLNNVTGTYRFHFATTGDLDYDAWASLAGKTFGPDASWNGYNYDADAGNWIEVTSGSQADMIISVKNRTGISSGPTQAEMNATYAELSGVGDPSDKFEYMKYGIQYSGHAGIGDADTGTQLLNFGPVNDVTSPVITITSPAGGLKTNVPSQTIAGTVSDAETLASGVKEAKVFLNGVQVGSTYTTSPVSFSETVTLAEGANTIRVDAVDNNGNTKSESINVVLDTVSPVVEILSVTQNGGSVLGGSPNALQGDVIITVRATDVGTGVNGHIPELTVTPFGGSPVALVGTAGSVAGTYTYTYNVTATTPNGLAEIAADVQDEAGNDSETAQGTFNINKNQITGFVELELFKGSEREVTFVVTAGTTVLKTWTINVTGFNTGISLYKAAYTLTDVPDEVTGLSAKTDWNLRKKVACALDANGQAVVGFWGTNKLPGGDLNGTNSVNINDYSVLKTNWFTSNAVADIDGSGTVNNDDYVIMKLNWFKSGDVQ